MGLLFMSDFHDEFGTWPLAYMPYGGIDFGEIMGVAQAVGDGDDSALYEARMPFIRSSARRFTKERLLTQAK